MTNYELALELLDKGMADKHHTFNDTGYLIIDLGGPYGGYISPNDKNVEITKYNGSTSNLNIPSTIDGKQVSYIGSDSFRGNIGYGDIDMDKMVVHDTANRFELPIEKYVNRSVKCVDERPVIANRRRDR